MTLSTLPRPSWATPATQPARRLWRPATAPHLALAAVFLAAYTLLSVLRYQRYGAPSWDLGIFTEAVKAYVHGNAPIVPIKGEHFNIVGDHFSPILAILAPLFRLFPTPVTLLAAQAALFAWSTGIVSDTAARLLGRARGLCVGTAYGLSFGLQRAVDVQFHEIAFAVPLLAVVCRQLLARRWQHAAWWALPLLLVKEDLGLTVAAVGVLLLVQGRRWWAGTILLLVGVAGTALAVWWVIPHFNPAHHYDYWTKLPAGRHAAWQAVSRLQSWKTVGWILGVTGMLAARSPLAVLTLPTLAWRLASDNPAYWGNSWHYDAVLMPIAFLAAADAAYRYRTCRRPRLRQAADRALTSMPAIAVAVMAALPVGLGDLARPDAWSEGPAGAARDAALRAIPDGVSVESTTAMLAPLAARTDAYWMGGSKAHAPQYIVLDRYDWRDAPTDGPGYAAGLHPGAHYRVVFQRGKVTVLRLEP